MQNIFRSIRRSGTFAAHITKKKKIRKKKIVNISTKRLHEMIYAVTRYWLAASLHQTILCIQKIVQFFVVVDVWLLLFNIHARRLRTLLTHMLCCAPRHHHIAVFVSMYRCSRMSWAQPFTRLNGVSHYDDQCVCARLRDTLKHTRSPLSRHRRYTHTHTLEAHGAPIRRARLVHSRVCEWDFDWCLEGNTLECGRHAGVCVCVLWSVTRVRGAH